MGAVVARTSWCQLVPSWYQLAPAGASWDQLVPAGTSWYAVGTSWYQVVPGWYKDVTRLVVSLRSE